MSAIDEFFADHTAAVSRMRLAATWSLEAHREVVARLRAASALVVLSYLDVLGDGSVSFHASWRLSRPDLALDVIDDWGTHGNHTERLAPAVIQYGMRLLESKDDPQRRAAWLALLAKLSSGYKPKHPVPVEVLSWSLDLLGKRVVLRGATRRIVADRDGSIAVLDGDALVPTRLTYCGVREHYKDVFAHAGRLQSRTVSWSGSFVWGLLQRYDHALYFQIAAWSPHQQCAGVAQEGTISGSDTEALTEASRLVSEAMPASGDPFVREKLGKTLRAPAPNDAAVLIRKYERARGSDAEALSLGVRGTSLVSAGCSPEQAALRPRESTATLTELATFPDGAAAIDAFEQRELELLRDGYYIAGLYPIPIPSLEKPRLKRAK